MRYLSVEFEWHMYQYWILSHGISIRQCHISRCFINTVYQYQSLPHKYIIMSRCRMEEVSVIVSLKTCQNQSLPHKSCISTSQC